MNDRSIYSCSTAVLVALGFACIGIAGCTWQEIKERGYGAMREHQAQRCLDDPSRQAAECVDHQPYDAYERDRSAPPVAP